MESVKSPLRRLPGNPGQAEGAGIEKKEVEKREAAQAFANRVVAMQYPAGPPLSMRQAQIVVDSSVMREVNEAAFKKLALKDVVPTFHEEATKILDEEMRQNADAGTRVLKDADFTPRLAA